MVINNNGLFTSCLSTRIIARWLVLHQRATCLVDTKGKIYDSFNKTHNHRTERFSDVNHL